MVVLNCKTFNIQYIIKRNVKHLWVFLLLLLITIQVYLIQTTLLKTFWRALNTKSKTQNFK